MSRAAQSPAAEALRTVRPLIDAVVRALGGVFGPLDRSTISERLRRVVQLAYIATDTPPAQPAHLDALYEASRIIDEIGALVLRDAVPAGQTAADDAVAALREVRVRLDHAVEAVAFDASLRRAWGTSITATTPFRASIGEPQLHNLPRGRFAPPYSVGVPEAGEVAAGPDEGPKPPTTFEELRAFAGAARAALAPKQPPKEEEEPEPPPPVRPWAESIDEAEAQRVIARDCLEDIGSLYLLRDPGEGESWCDQAPFEQRMLDALDAFASFGGVVLPMVTLYHAEAPSPDPARAFAVAFVLGCVAGSDTVDVAIATLRAAAPEEYPGFAEGFALASNPAIDLALGELLGHPSAELARLAVEVLDRRGTFPLDWVDSLVSRRDDVLTAAVLRALGNSGSRLQVISMVEPWALPAAPSGIFEAACETLLRRGHGPVRDLLRSELTGAHAGVAQSLLCLAGRPEDVSGLLELAWNRPTLSLARGLGRFGHLDAFGTLQQLLGHEDEQLALAAAGSLETITGAGLTTIVEEPWDPARAADPAFAGKPVPMRKVKKPSRDVAAWESWKRDHAARLDPLRKHRGGKPFVPSMLVDELAAPHTPPSERAIAWRELRLASGTMTRFSPRDWVQRQQQLMPVLREDAGKVGAQPGSWCLAGAGTLGSPRRR